VTAEPIRQQARHLYHGKGRTARYVSKQLALPLDQVLELVRERPLPRCIRPGCGKECARDGARYCSRSCALAVLVQSRKRDGATVGCGCTDDELCGVHAARLERARGRG
jgi:hypothetical protein